MPGASINQVSVVAMIVVMGIIVDDAIVVGEAIFHHRKLGKSPIDAAIDGVREVGLPVIASVTTTIVANLPLAFIAGIFGHFVFQVPLVVVSALTVSLVECLILLPAHLNHRKRKLAKPETAAWRKEVGAVPGAIAARGIARILYDLTVMSTVDLMENRSPRCIFIEFTPIRVHQQLYAA